MRQDELKQFIDTYKALSKWIVEPGCPGYETLRGPSTWTQSGRGWTRNGKRLIGRSLLNVRTVKERHVWDISGMKISSSDQQSWNLPELCGYVRGRELVV